MHDNSTVILIGEEVPVHMLSKKNRDHVCVASQPTLSTTCT